MPSNTIRDGLDTHFLQISTVEKLDILEKLVEKLKSVTKMATQLDKMSLS